MDGKLQAAIGIGSNSARLLVARRVGERIEAVRRMEEVTRLAGYTAPASATPRLDPRAIEATLQAVRSFVEAARELHAPIVGMVATAAMRTAANSHELADSLAQEVGVPVTVVSGEEEARLGWNAVTLDNADTESTLGVIDVGGGSSDLAVGYAHEVLPQAVLSIPVGARTAMKRYDLDKRVEYSKTVGIIASLGIELYDGAAAMEPRPQTAVAIGGTAEVLMEVYAKLEGAKPDGNTKLDRDWLGRNVVRLAALDHAGRVEMGVPADRADVAVAGGAILLVLLDAWGMQKFHVSERGILDGYLASL